MLISDKTSPRMRSELAAAKVGVQVAHVHLGKTRSSDGVLIAKPSDAERRSRS
jgi:hypothetical protein